MNQELIINQIKEKGYYILKNYYNIEFINKIIDDINKVNSSHRGEGNDIRIPNFEKFSVNANIFLKEDFFIKIGTGLLNGECDRIKKRCQLGILKYKNGNECSGGGWHVDNHNPQFKALLYLSNVTINNGPFAIISPPITSKDYTPISSEKNTRFSDKIEIDYKNSIHYLTGNIGDVILVNTQNIHRGTVIKQGIRLSLTNYYYD